MLLQHRPGSGRLAAMAVPFLLALAGCVGTIGDPPDNDRKAGATLPSGQGPSGEGVSPGEREPVTRDTRLRRLSHGELLNSVRDLLFLPDVSEAANLLPEHTFDGFANDADMLRTDDLTIDRYDTVAT